MLRAGNQERSVLAYLLWRKSAAAQPASTDMERWARSASPHAAMQQTIVEVMSSFQADVARRQQILEYRIDEMRREGEELQRTVVRPDYEEWANEEDQVALAKLPEVEKKLRAAERELELLLEAITIAVRRA